MCNNTKQRIAAALRQLMAEKSFEKITVRNLMDATNMKRQSFYYHFQDTRDVLMWICRQDLIEPLANSPLEFTDWILQALTLLAEDRVFYRKLLGAAHQDFVRDFGALALGPRMEALLYPRADGRPLNSDQQFAVDFAVQAVIGRMVQFVHSRDALDPRTFRRKIEYLLDKFGVGAP